MTFVTLTSQKNADAPALTYSQYDRELLKGNLKKVVVVDGRELQAETKQPITVNGSEVTRFTTTLVGEVTDRDKDALRNAGVELSAKAARTSIASVLLNILPYVLLFGFWLFLFRQMQAGGAKAFSFGKSKAKLLTGDTPKVTFADVAGADEAKVELQEIIEFLKDPQKFTKLGGRLPKGALLVGPPGTGKTLLARAVAGEAGRPFFSMSGSDFVEMFVGVGASRVRDLFEQGKASAPCIIFIDEIDAVGRHRGSGMGGGHDEREQTLNQLLVEMDGFESNEGVILIAATNRPDVLDPALLRPGRFDLEEAKDKVQLGAERKSLVMREEERRLTAYHEAGHAVCAIKIKGNDPLHKVTIVPRGRALGVAFTLPEDDRVSVTREQIEARLVMAYGGRTAEELIFGREHVTTGASSDIQQATGIARRYVSQWGLSDAVGPILVGDNEQEMFLGRELSSRREVSEKTAQLVDAEVSRVIKEAYNRAKAALEENIDLLHSLAKNLLERETLTREDIGLLVRGQILPPRVDPPSNLTPPVAPPQPAVVVAAPEPKRIAPPLLGGPGIVPA